MGRHSYETGTDFGSAAHAMVGAISHKPCRAPTTPCKISQGPHTSDGHEACCITQAAAFHSPIVIGCITVNQGTGFPYESAPKINVAA